MNLIFVGDAMLGQMVNSTLKTEPPAYPWGDTLSLFRSGDVRLCNLECVISDRGRPWSRTPKVFHFRADAKNVAVLQQARMDVVTVANNHSLDFETEALLDMLQLLDLAGIRHAGAGANLAEASRAAHVHVNGMRIGVLAFTNNEPAWAAGEYQPGLLYVPIHVADRRATELYDLVRQTKNEVDFLVVSAHWGPNWGYAPPSEHGPFARALIDAGADLIFGHSGHVFRGIECYQQRPIVYCAGNFIDDYAVDDLERNDQSFVFVADIENRHVRTLKLYPTIIRDCQARLATGPEQEQIVHTMQHLCAQLHTPTRWLRDGYLEVGVAESTSSTA